MPMGNPQVDVPVSSVKSSRACVVSGPCLLLGVSGVSDRGAANLQTRFHIQPVFTMSAQPVKLR